MERNFSGKNPVKILRGMANNDFETRALNTEEWPTEMFLPTSTTADSKSRQRYYPDAKRKNTNSKTPISVSLIWETSFLSTASRRHESSADWDFKDEMQGANCLRHPYANKERLFYFHSFCRGRSLNISAKFSTHSSQAIALKKP